MASTNKLNIRIQNKYSEYTLWQDKNPVLLAGEIAVVTVPATSGVVPSEPAVLFKVGDGVTAFNSLPWVKAVAADVYDWAKAENKPTYAATEITGLADYIGEKIQDTNTTYRLAQDATDGHVLKFYSKELGGEETEIASITTVDTVYDDSAVRALISGIDARVTTLEGEMDAVEGRATELETRMTKAEEDVAANAKAISDEATRADTAEKANAAAAAEAKAAADAAQGAADAAQKAADDEKTRATTAEGALDTRLTAAEGKVTTLIGDDAGLSVRTIANQELAAQLIPDDAKESLDTLAEIAAWIQDHPDDASAMNQAIQAIQAQLEGIAAGNGAVKNYVDDAIAALAIGDYAKAADLAALVTRVTTAEEDIGKLETAVAEAKTAIDANDADIKQNAADIAANAQAIAKHETDTTAALATKANTADLAAIATSGNVADLKQTEGEWITLYCGSATELI